MISAIERGIDLKLFQKASSFLENLLAILVAVMVILVFANVLTRYIFHVSIAWSEEIARFMFIFVVALGAILALAKDEHLNIELYSYFKSPLIARIFKALSMLFVIIALGIYVSGGAQLVRLGMSHPAPVTGIPLGLVYLVVVASLAIMLIIAIQKFINLFKGDS